MYSIVSNNIAELYEQALRKVKFGSITKPRGYTCYELAPISMTLLDPTKNILTNPVRKINRGFMAAEFLWIVRGQSDVKYISQFNSRIANYSDDGKTFFGAYGPKFKAQFDYVVSNLEHDPWTRQAVMTFWRDNPPKTKDVPCTVMLHFMRRPINTLNLIVYMRSNDVWLGLPYDIHNFTSIQIMLAQKLKLKVGTYTHIDGSLHAYENDLDKINTCIASIKSTEFNLTRPDANVVVQKDNEVTKYLKEKNEKLNNKK